MRRPAVDVSDRDRLVPVHRRRADDRGTPADATARVRAARRATRARVAQRPGPAVRRCVGTLLGSTAQMAPSTALLMVLVSVGAMALLGPSGPTGGLPGPTSSSRLARRLLFAAMVVPALVAWVRLQGEEHGLVAAGTGTSLMVLATFALLAIAIWQTARVAGRTETARKAALDELRPVLRGLGRHARDRRRRWSAGARQPGLERRRWAIRPIRWSVSGSSTSSTPMTSSAP